MESHMTTEQMKQNNIALDSRTEFCDKLTSCIGNAIQWLMGQQKEDGHWIGRTETNACMEAQACLALWFLGLEDHPLRVRLGNALLKTRREDGSWGVFWNASNGDINATVESYAALRSLGYDKDLPFMKETRAWIFSKGGLKNIRVFTRYWLALVGEWPWEKTPNVPPEVIWLPL
jgi:squalene-hopene/tetraprenyl-beta-curcumene cyclase